MTISNDKREEIERELVSLVLNKNEIIDFLQIKPKYLSNNKIAKILEYSIECYKNNKVVSPTKILELHKDFDIDLFAELLIDVFYQENTWREQLKVAEETIIINYKEDYIKILNNKLERKEISYKEFTDKIKKLDLIQLTNRTSELTALEILNNINETKSRIFLNGFQKLNDTLKIVQGDFVIVGATTGAGKSGFLLNLMNSLMGDYQCMYFNMEMSKSTIYKRLISIRSGVPINYINNPTEYQKQLIGEAIKEIERNKVIVEHKANDIKNIKSLLAKVKDENKHTILFIDHLGLTRCDERKSLYEQTTEVAKQLRQMCLEYDCTVIGASQLNRGAYNSEQITLSMLKDSGELENSASKVILLYRDSSSNKEDLQVVMNVDIAKNRDGITGIIKMEYDKTKQIFKEIVCGK